MSLDDSEGKEDEKTKGGLDSDLVFDPKKELVEAAEKQPSDALTVAGALGLIAGKDRFADVWFLVGSGKDSRRIPAHRVILAASSDIFEAMLYPTAFPEDDKDKDKSKDASASSASLDDSGSKDADIEITDVKPATFKIMLQCIYGDTAEIKAEDLPDLIACAKKFQLESLRLLCVQFMEEGVTADNACTLFESAVSLLNEKQFALSYIEENAADVIASTAFEALSKDRVQTILRSSKLCADEIDVFAAVMKWSIAECKRQDQKDDVTNKRAALKEVLELVRFPIMTMEDIATFVSPSGILDSSNLLEIFTYLGQPDSKKPKTKFPTAPRLGSTDKWTLDSSLHSSAVTISDKNLKASNTSSSHGYCLGTQTWTKGQHAWRVTRTSGGSEWLLLGVSKKESHQDASYNGTGFYGASSANQKYIAGSASSLTTNFATGPLDILFDADEGKLTIYNSSASSTMEITGIPKNTPLCPHFGPHNTQTITITAIKVRDFKKSK